MILKTIIAGLLMQLSILSCAAAQERQANMFDVSRSSTVKVVSKTGDSKGTGFFIGEQHIATCFHVIAALSVEGNNIKWAIHPDLEVVLPSGESIGATLVTIPTQKDPSPLMQDYAILRLKQKPKEAIRVLMLAPSTASPFVGDEIVFSGFPLATPGMVTHRGMVSGYDDQKDILFLQGAINKGNSGGAVLNASGAVIGIVSMREGGISKGLQELSLNIAKSSASGRVEIMGIDPLQATRAIIQTVDTYYPEHLIDDIFKQPRSARVLRESRNGQRRGSAESNANRIGRCRSIRLGRPDGGGRRRWS